MKRIDELWKTIFAILLVSPIALILLIQVSAAFFDAVSPFIALGIKIGCFLIICAGIGLIIYLRLQHRASAQEGDQSSKTTVAPPTPLVFPQPMRRPRRPRQ